MPLPFASASSVSSTVISTVVSTEARAPPDVMASTAPATELTLDRLRTATRQAQAVRVDYVTADGRTVERELSPLDLVSGSVRAVDRASAPVVTIPLARISGVSPVA